MPSIFSRIITGEIPSHRIAEDDDFVAFLDIRPLNPGHALVIPKCEVDQFFDLDEALLARILVFSKPISRAIQTVTGAERVAAIVAGFDVPHAHLHLIPAFTMADLDFSPARPDSDSELSVMAQRLRQVLR